MENKEKILKMFKHVKIVTSLDKIEDSIKLGQLFIEHHLLRVLGRDPNFPNEVNKKYPKHTIYAPPVHNRMTDKGFYSWTIERSHTKLAIMLTVVILIVITFMLFNIWPLWLKKAIWYLSFYMLVVLVRPLD